MLSSALLLTLFCLVSSEYKPTWVSLESRPLPTWYDEVKFGIFCHWGVYSVPAYKSEWFWWYWKHDPLDPKHSPDPKVVKYVEDNYEPGISYAEFAKDFRAELFDPNEFVEVVKSAGAKYFILTSKHVEGFTMWPSKYSWNWNSMDAGPHRDIVGDLKEAFSTAGIHFGVYYCLYEWFNSLFIQDMTSNSTDYIHDVTWPQMVELVQKYKPDIFWSDGDWMRNDTYWKSKEFIAWVYNESPVKDRIILNDRWGGDDMGKHGGYLTFKDNFDPGVLIPRKWENCLNMDSESWGNRRNMQINDVITVHKLIEQLARTISCGGNFLLNVGPDKHGRIPLIFQSRLAELGRFVKIMDEAIFTTKPWVYQNDSGNAWYTARYKNKSHSHKLFLNQYERETIIYAWILDVPSGNIPLPRIKITEKLAIPINTCPCPQSIKCRCWTNRYGYKCCNHELELFMELTINNPFNPEKWLNLSKDCVADKIQMLAQQLFKKSFEVQVADGEICGKNSFRGDMYCKIRTYDGKVAQAYATPVPYSIDPCCPNRPLSMMEIQAQSQGSCSISDVVTEM